jgi:ubiquinone/menaquinone biosynthesis C-methylase UbiE
MTIADDDLLAAQSSYYSARAREYDDWWHRRGRYDSGPEVNARWFRERARLFQAMTGAGLSGHVLELACGTGAWTERLAAQGLRVTAVDASAEMLALNRARVGDGTVEYVRADLFQWTPDRLYDGVVMGFWLSHVPPERLDPFLRTVRAAAPTGGRLFVVDSQYQDEAAARDRVLTGRRATTTTRILADGRRFEIVKVFYEPPDLEAAFERAGFRVSVERTESFFIHGAGEAV